MAGSVALSPALEAALARLPSSRLRSFTMEGLGLAMSRLQAPGLGLAVSPSCCLARRVLTASRAVWGVESVQCIVNFF